MNAPQIIALAHGVGSLGTAAVLASIWHRDHTKVYSLMWAGMFVFSALGWVLLTMPPPADWGAAVVHAGVTDLVFPMAFALLALGTSRYVGGDPRKTMLAAVVAGGFAAGTVCFVLEAPLWREMAGSLAILILLARPIRQLAGTVNGNVGERGMLAALLVIFLQVLVYAGLVVVQQPEAIASTESWGFDMLMLSMPLAVTVLGLSGVLTVSLQLIGEVEQLARVDALTGVPNRRGFMEAAARDFLRARRSGRPLTMVVADLDWFKMVNDRFGHAVGDAVLAAAAEAIRQNVRPGDTVGRLGGEEFAICLPDSDSEQGRLVADRIRRALPDCLPAGLPADLRVTASFGVAEWRRDDSAVDCVINHADKALYRAKNGGRDRVVVEDPERAPAGEASLLAAVPDCPA